MNRYQRAAIVSALAQKLRNRGSWCGETHIQKATFFLQDMFKVPIGYEFVLYKFGPFSFDLRDELSAMRADHILDLEPAFPYGPHLFATVDGKELLTEYSKSIEDFEPQIELVALKLGEKDVSELERLATAWFVTREMGATSEKERADQLHRLKPHVSVLEALAAVREADELSEATSGAL